MTPEWDTNNSLAERLEASQRLADEGLQARIGSVELGEVSLTRAPQLEESEAFQRMTDRLENSEQVVKLMEARGEFRLEELLVETLDRFVQAGKLDGMMIASDEGLVVAQSTWADRADVLAAVSSLFQSTVSRAQSEQLIQSVEEMSLRGFAGEQIVVRYFSGLEKRMFLIAYSREPRSYRRVTARALKICGDLLLRSRRPRHKARPTPPEPPAIETPVTGLVTEPDAIAPAATTPEGVTDETLTPNLATPEGAPQEVLTGRPEAPTAVPPDPVIPNEAEFAPAVDREGTTKQ